MSDGVHYTELGRYMMSVTDKNKGIRGPYNVANYMAKEAARRGYDLGRNKKGEPRTLPGGGAASKHYRGESYPEPWWISAFAELFDLSHEQREGLADHYAYRFRVVA